MASRAMLPLVALLLLSPGGGVAKDARRGACNVTQFSTQLDGMLSTYDREWAPDVPTVVEVALVVRHASINEASATVRLLADLRMSWEDKRLGWNASGGGACDSALVSAERLWRPDVALLSAGAARDASDAGQRARLSAGGRVAWTERLDLEAPVALDLTAWPRDHHRVVFKFGSRSHFVDEIDLNVPELLPATVFESGSWELMAVESSEAQWERSGANTRVALYAVTLRRRAAAHALAVAAVLVSTALLLVAAALLPPEARAPVCGTASFTAALWLAAAVSRVGGAQAAPRSLIALGAWCACGAAAAAAAAVALRLARCTLTQPRALRILLTNSATLRALSPFQVRGGAEESGAWAAAARLLDALCVLALLLAVALTAVLLVVL